MYRQGLLFLLLLHHHNKVLLHWQPHHPAGERTGTSGILNQSQAGAWKEQVYIPYSSKGDPGVEDNVICDDDLNLAPLQEIN